MRERKRVGEVEVESKQFYPQVDKVSDLSALAPTCTSMIVLLLGVRYHVLLWFRFIKQVHFNTLLVCGFIVCPSDGCSSRGLLIEMEALTNARVVVTFIDVVSRLGSTFVCCVSHG